MGIFDQFLAQVQANNSPVQGYQKLRSQLGSLFSSGEAAPLAPETPQPDMPAPPQPRPRLPQTMVPGTANLAPPISPVEMAPQFDSSSLPAETEGKNNFGQKMLNILPLLLKAGVGIGGGAILGDKAGIGPLGGALAGAAAGLRRGEDVGLAEDKAAQQQAAAEELAKYRQRQTDLSAERNDIMRNRPRSGDGSGGLPNTEASKRYQQLRVLMGGQPITEANKAQFAQLASGIFPENKQGSIDALASTYNAFLSPGKMPAPVPQASGLQDRIGSWIKGVLGGGSVGSAPAAGRVPTSTTRKFEYVD